MKTCKATSNGRQRCMGFLGDGPGMDFSSLSFKQATHSKRYKYCKHTLMPNALSSFFALRMSPGFAISKPTAGQWRPQRPTHDHRPRADLSRIHSRPGRVWVNPGEIAGNGIDDDGNGDLDHSLPPTTVTRRKTKGVRIQSFRTKGL